jgi:hypothetical protein
MFFPDKDKGHREAHRVLVSGGHYIFSVWDSDHYNPIGRLITDILAGFFPEDPPQFFIGCRSATTGSIRSRILWLLRGLLT